MRLLKASIPLVQAAQGVSGPHQIVPKAAAASGDGDFNSMMEEILAPNASNQVSEESLFAALTVERVKAYKGDEAASKYKDLLHSTESTLMVGDYIPYEDSARIALRDFRDSGELTQSEADKIHSEAFGAAQLDDNDSALYDDIGGNGSDSTFAALDISEAIAIAKGKIDKYNTGELTATTRALDDGFAGDGSSLVNPYENGGGSPSSDASDAAAADSAEASGGDLTSQAIKLAPGELLGSFLHGTQSGSGATNILLRSSMGKIVEEGYGSVLHSGNGADGRRSLEKI